MTRTIHRFFYACLCDVYLEAIKDVLADPEHPHFESTLETLHICLTTGLKLMHPLMPYVTEELHQRLHGVMKVPCQSIMVESYPSPNEVKINGFLKRDLIKVSLSDSVVAMAGPTSAQ